MQRQHTLAGEARFVGVGLHGGRVVAMRVAPAPADAGVVFVRTDLDSAEIPARSSALGSVRRATTLRCGEASVATVEHLLAALFALGIDNARVELDGPEVPAADGSAAPFVALLERAGRVAQDAERVRLRLARPIEIEDGTRRIRARPADGLHVRYAIDFPHPAIGRQELALGPIDAELFARALAPARTFGFVEEVEALRSAGLALGGDLANAVVFDAKGVITPGGLRVPDEPVRHKALDLVGDLALLGRPLDAAIEVERGGHALHQRLVAAIGAQTDASG
ncbi:MAG: UDP-3-O-[3-hydroxymyristoyl] N-acetylglucosamine deacetylase [Myxococcales bacterium]|nr:UDP-3-O-[3-hydroxymyristoyl] N-acetylglucosamine deacetylase [Myxococcales bacterium]